MQSVVPFAPATIHDVARAAGVSIKTVSRVLNNESPVRPETAARVRAACAALNYSINPAARRLGGGRTRSIGVVVVAEANWQWTADLIAGGLTQARERGYGVVPYVLRPNDAAERASILHVAAQRLVDGLVLTTPWAENAELIEDLAERGMALALAPAPAGARALSVRVDDALAAERATAHLLELGHRRIAVIAGQRVLDATRQRMRGFRSAMKAAGVAVEPRLIHHDDYSFRTGVHGGRRLLTLEDPPTAILGLTDILAAGALRSAHELGVAVPKAVSIAGIGDLAVSQLVWPPLTTVQIPTLAMAAKAVDLLIDSVEGNPAPDQVVTFETQLIVRQSTGPLQA